MKLNIPIVKQIAGRDDCLRCTLFMIFKYYKIDIGKSYIWKHLPLIGRNAYFTDAGRIAISKGLEATIIHGNSTWWDKYCAEARNKEELIDSIGKMKSGNMTIGKVRQKEIDFVMDDGNFIFKKPTLKTIDEFLEKNIPIIITSNPEKMYGLTGVTNAHTVVVAGKGEKGYYIIDPLRGEHTISNDILLSAWSDYGGWVLAIEKH